MSTRAKARGFTLMEMVIVVALLGVTAAAVVTMVAQVGAGQSDNSDLQVGTQLLQECGEWIVSNHRRDESFFTATLVTNASCYGLSWGAATSFAGYSKPSVVVSSYTGTGCPSGATCKLATISVTKGGFSLNPVNLVVVRYNPL